MLQIRAKFLRNCMADTESRLREMSETYKQIRRITHSHDKAVLRSAGKEDVCMNFGR